MRCYSGVHSPLKSRPGTLKLALKRGALVTAANWQVVLVQFVADTLFKTLLAVPIVGGVVLVVLLIGGDPKDLLRLEPAQIIPTMVGVLLAQPLALIGFLIALVLVLIGGSLLTIAVKAGVVTVLVDSERAAGIDRAGAAAHLRAEGRQSDRRSSASAAASAA